MKSKWLFTGLFLGLGFGLATNLLWGQNELSRWITQNVAAPLAELFLRIIFLAIPTLAFSALALGVAGFRELGNLGRIALTTLIYSIVASTLAVALGLLLMNVFRPGLIIGEETRQSLLALAGPAGPAAAPADGLLGVVQWIPDPLKILGAGGVLLLLAFAVITGLGLGRSGREADPLAFSWLEWLLDLSTKVVGFAMWMAPVGIAALVFRITSQLGLDILGSLGAFGLLTFFGLAFHQFVTYGLILRFGAKTSPRVFFAAIKEVMATAFATSSSNATLPTAIRVAEEKLRLPPEISRFVLTAGATANQNGTALYEGVTILFLAQLYLGHNLGFLDQLYVLGMSILAGVGTAGVPSGSIPFIRMICEAVKVPGNAVGTILGLDRILDMCRTVLNVSGDLVAATFVAKREEKRKLPLG